MIQVGDPSNAPFTVEGVPAVWERVEDKLVGNGSFLAFQFHPMVVPRSHQAFFIPFADGVCFAREFSAANISDSFFAERYACDKAYNRSASTSRSGVLSDAISEGEPFNCTRHCATRSCARCRAGFSGSLSMVSSFSNSTRASFHLYPS